MSFSKEFPLTIITVFALTALSRQAFASGDGGCSPAWRMLHRSYDGCDNMAFLSPSNDTRVNLLLLLADRHGIKPTANAFGRPDAPLFPWDTLSYRLAPQATQSTADHGTQDAPSSCNSPVPPDDPFSRALQAETTLKAEERTALLLARSKTQSGCPTEAAVNAVSAAQQTAKSTAARSFALYLEGAAAFWKSDYTPAVTTFTSLQNAQVAWVRETATYMVGRSLINRAQVGAFDEYGSFNKDWHADPVTVTEAEASLDRYLQQYPKGAYAQSARGLKRRGYWLAHDTPKLEQEYGALLLLSPAERNISDIDLVQEIDNKITTPSDSLGIARNAGSIYGLAKSTTNPLLLAMLDLQAMRSPADAASGSATQGSADLLSIAAVEKQKPYFASQMPLYEYLLAVHALYVENNPADVLRMIPDATHQASFTYLQFSRQVLRGMALEAVKDGNALGFWMQMLPGAKAAYQRPALELAIAFHEERAGHIRDVFAPDSPVHYPYLREVLLANVADADLLRTQANNASAPQRERDISLFTLLYKEATRGDSMNFLKDLALVPPTAPTQGYYALDTLDSYFSADPARPPAAIPLGIFLHGKTSTEFPCPGLRASEQQLAQDASNPSARLCLADFVRLNQDVIYPAFDSTIADELGATPSLFPGGTYVRIDTYTAVLANPKSSKDEKAYALFRAVNCYGPSGNNSCGGKDVSKAQRKAWFTTLKRDYAGTRWADELRYYW